MKLKSGDGPPNFELKLAVRHGGNTNYYDCIISFVVCYYNVTNFYFNVFSSLCGSRSSPDKQRCDERKGSGEDEERKDK